MDVYIVYFVFGWNKQKKTTFTFACPPWVHQVGSRLGVRVAPSCPLGPGPSGRVTPVHHGFRFITHSFNDFTSNRNGPGGVYGAPQCRNKLGTIYGIRGTIRYIIAHTEFKLLVHVYWDTEKPYNAKIASISVSFYGPIAIGGVYVLIY